MADTAFTRNEKVVLFDGLARSLRWAMSQISEKADGLCSPVWYCPHCDGRGTGYRPDPIHHKLDCPWLQAQHVLDEVNDPELKSGLRLTEKGN